MARCARGWGHTTTGETLSSQDSERGPYVLVDNSREAPTIGFRRRLYYELLTTDGKVIRVRRGSPGGKQPSKLRGPARLLGHNFRTNLYILYPLIHLVPIFVHARKLFRITIIGIHIHRVISEQGPKR